MAIPGTLNSSLPGNFVRVPLCEAAGVSSPLCSLGVFFLVAMQIHANVFLFRNADSGRATQNGR